MDKKFKACMQPHALLHSLAGLGVGFIIAGLVPAAAAQGVVLGIIAVVAAVIGDMAVNKG